MPKRLAFPSAVTLVVMMLAAIDTSADWTTNGVGICVNTSRNQQHPASAPDGAGGSFIAWTGFPLAGGNDIRVARISRAGDLPWVNCGIAAASAANTGQTSRGTCRIVEDGAGGALLTWTDARASGVSGQDIYAQRITSAGGIASGWPSDGSAACTATGTQDFPVRFGAIASDGSGGCYITWEDSRPTANGVDIYLQRLNSKGVVMPGWPANGLPVCSATNAQSKPSVISDGANGAIVVWDDRRNNNTTGADIYGVRVDSSAVRVSNWAADGTVICDALGDQTNPTLVSDGSTERSLYGRTVAEVPRQTLTLPASTALDRWQQIGPQTAMLYARPRKISLLR
jgi:hypothetical protein